MKYRAWVKTVPATITADPLWKMKVYRYALFLSDIAWNDLKRLSNDNLMQALSDQLYRAVGSIQANISEGYSRKSKLDQARFYEYAFGSARETRGWYYSARHKLSDETYESRLLLLEEIIKMLLHIIPQTRKNKVNEQGVTYTKQSSEDVEKHNFK